VRRGGREFVKAEMGGNVMLGRADWLRDKPALCRGRGPDEGADEGVLWGGGRVGDVWLEMSSALPSRERDSRTWDFDLL
jgi:hypothetical protein